jgi:hypothetical protein
VEQFAHDDLQIYRIDGSTSVQERAAEVSGVSCAKSE